MSLSPLSHFFPFIFFTGCIVFSFSYRPLRRLSFYDHPPSSHPSPSPSFSHLLNMPFFAFRLPVSGDGVVSNPTRGPSGRHGLVGGDCSRVPFGIVVSTPLSSTPLSTISGFRLSLATPGELTVSDRVRRPTFFYLSSKE